MKTSLLEGLRNEDKEEFKQLWARSYQVRERLKEVLERKKEGVVSRMISAEMTKNSKDYGLEQASNAAEARKIDEFISLLQN